MNLKLQKKLNETLSHLQMLSQDLWLHLIAYNLQSKLSEGFLEIKASFSAFS